MGQHYMLFRIISKIARNEIITVLKILTASYETREANQLRLFSNYPALFRIHELTSSHDRLATGKRAYAVLPIQRARQILRSGLTAMDGRGITGIGTLLLLVILN